MKYLMLARVSAIFLSDAVVLALEVALSRVICTRLACIILCFNFLKERVCKCVRYCSSDFDHTA